MVHVNSHTSFYIGLTVTDICRAFFSSIEHLFIYRALLKSIEVITTLMVLKNEVEKNDEISD